MDPKHLRELMTVENNYWWHVAKREMVFDILQRHFPPPRRLAEGGVGAGGNILALQERGYQVTGFDLMPEAVSHCQSQGVNDVRVHDLQEPWPVPDGSVDVVLMLDVLEHMAEPVRVMRHAARALKADGALVFTVPACPYLMGPWDRMLGHYRRYTGKLLRRQAQEAGMQVSWLSHWNAFTYPAALVIRLLEKVWSYKRSAEFPAVSRPMNNVLWQCARVEQKIMRRIRIPLGLSLVGVLKP